MQFNICVYIYIQLMRWGKLEYEASLAQVANLLISQFRVRHIYNDVMCKLAAL